MICPEYQGSENRLKTLLLKGVLVYLLVMGVMGSYLSALGIRFSWVALHVVIFLCTMYCAALYYNKLWQDIGYLLLLGAMAAGAGYADRVLALASSHFASAERQFRFPLAYGNQRPQSTTWTVTGCGCVMIEGNEKNEGKDGRRAKENASESLKNAGQEKLHPKFQPCISAATPGKIVDMQMRDSMNMGAAMAVAAVDTILQNFRDFNRKPSDYDRIITGDLGMVGKEILLDFMREAGQDISSIHMDCGIEMFDPKTQDTHSGGSGCGCSAAVLCGYILPKIQAGEWKRVLFVPTGALLSQISFNEGQNVPGIAHGVVLEGKESFGE